ncbi:Mysoin-binding motif of peroxisomes-domain-containing protein [Gaertneriomyces semiglobifer]|nr:Mysoin-binding motif of peroxisomes-domain-containing protein [Gaertneriomyces semiglobifer]
MNEVVVFAGTPLGDYLSEDTPPELEPEQTTAREQKPSRWATIISKLHGYIYLLFYPAPAPAEADLVSAYKEHVYTFLIQHLRSSENKPLTIPPIPPHPELWNVTTLIGVSLVTAVVGLRGIWSSHILSGWRPVCYLLLAAPFLLGSSALMGRANLSRRFNHSLSALDNFLHSTYDLDASLRKAIRMIQEIELVARGYRLSAKLPPITRIEHSSEARRCLILRAVTRDALKCSQDALDTATKSLYQLSPVMGDEHPSRPPSPATEGAQAEAEQLSLRSLKDDFERWRTRVVEFLNQILLIAQVGRIGNTTPWHILIEILTSITTKHHTQRITLRNALNAELGILPLARTEGESAHGTRASHAFYKSATSVGYQLQELHLRLKLFCEDVGEAQHPLDDTATALADFDKLSMSVKSVEAQLAAARLELEALLSGAVVSSEADADIPELERTWDLNYYTQRLGVHDASSDPYGGFADLEEEEVYEGGAQDLADEYQELKKLSRAERIQRRAQERALEQQSRHAQVHRSEMVNELRSVIAGRALIKRRGTNEVTP